MGTKIWLGICILCIGVGATLMHKLRAPEVKIVEREVVKEVTKSVTVKKVTKSPDGTTVTESTTTKDKQKDATKQKLVDLSSLAEKWVVSGTYDSKENYGVIVQRRVLGRVHIGIGANSAGIGMVSAGVSF